jgi:TonB-dependent starch-binding outer membrane protein SusC
MTRARVRLRVPHAAEGTGSRPGLRGARALGAVAFVLALLLQAGQPLAAQETATLTGTVHDEAGMALDAAEVVVAGTDRRTLTDRRGRFLITGVRPGLQTVEVRRLGYRAASQQVQVAAGSNELSFQLRYSPLALDEVVVTGQGSEISRRRLSTNIDVISSEAIAASPATRLDQLLQANLPGVQVRIASGQPGSTSVMRGRGPVSVSRSTTPVIYVDGVRVDNLNTQAELSLNTSGNRRQGTQTSAIADIPLENIERVEYIPGGAATTLYGSDAANGVIQIFTKKGTPGPTQFSLETELGVEQMNRAYFHFPQTVDLLYRNGLTQQHRLSASGGGQDATWSFAGSIRDREGFRIDNNASRNYQGRTGLAANISPTLRYDGSFSFGWNHYERSRDGNAGGYAPLWLLEGGRIFALGFNNQLDQLTPAGMDSLRAFINQAEALQNYRVEVSRFQTSQSFRWQPQSDLTFRGLIGLDHRTSNERGVVSNAFLVHTRAQPVGTTDRGSISSYDRRFLGLSMEGAGQYQYNRGPLSLVTSVGAQLFRDDDAQDARVANNVRDGSLTVRGAGISTADDFFLTVVNYGAYVQQNWSFFERYVVELGLRGDANSAFGSQVGTQYYPKLGLVYDVGREPFFLNSVSQDLISGLRFRANYGVAGNFPPPFAHDRTVSFNSYLGGQAVGFGNPGNPDLRPEKTTTVEVGGELEALGGRLTLQFTGYDARTRDALFLAPSAPSTGEAVQLRNVGEIQNRGTELRIAGDVVRTENLSLRLSGAYNTLHNEVVSTGGAPDFDISGFSSSTITSTVSQGMPVGYLRGSMPTFGPDGQIASVERLAYLGKPLPDRFGSLGMEMTVQRSLRFNADADWQTGAQMHSFDRQFRFNHGLTDPQVPEALHRRTPRSSFWLDLTGVFVEDSDYLKVRNISAAYTVPDAFTGRWASGLEVGLAVQNPFGWWSSSFDPESDHSGAASQGAATVGGFNYGTDPSPRTFLGTVRVRF